MTDYKRGFIAVHVGAGQHSKALIDTYQKLCRVACKQGMNCLKLGGSSLDAVTEATKVLEDSPLTNAGFGSNLTIDGKVECDASVMNGEDLHFGAAGAVSGVKNPVELAKRLCQRQNVKFSYGRIPPSFLVGDGALIWAKEMGLETLQPDLLVSPKAKKAYTHYKRKIDSAENIAQVKAKTMRLDTVGAVCVDEFGNVASACSSGGILLKCPGRVGQAGVWGCGVWARKSSESCIGSSTSGCGEHLVRTTLARSVAEAVQDGSCPTTSLHNTMQNKFIDSEFLQSLDQKLGGAIVIKYSPQDGFGDFLWSHSTNSMIVGYMNSSDNKATSRISVLASSNVGKKATVEGLCFKLLKKS